MALTREQLNINTKIQQDVLRRKKKKNANRGVNNSPFRTGDGRAVDPSTGLPIGNFTPKFNKFGVQVGSGSKGDTFTKSPTNLKLDKPSSKQGGGQVALPQKKQKSQLEILQDQISSLTEQNTQLSDKRAAEKKKTEAKRGTRGIEAGQTSVSADNPFAVDVSGLDTQSQNLIQGLKDQTELEKQLGASDAQAGARAIESLRRSGALADLRDTEIDGQSSASFIRDLEQQQGRRFTSKEIANVIAENGIDITDDVMERILREGNNTQDNLKVELGIVESAGTFALENIQRAFNRQITAREEHNIQQDARLRRMANIFGSANVSTANAAIMESKEKGVRVLDDLTSEFAGRLDVTSAKVFGAVKIITNNINLIEAQKAEAIQDKYLELQEAIQGFVDQGITDSEDLRKATATKRKEYFDDYRQINDVALNLLNDQATTKANVLAEANAKLSKNENIFNNAVSNLRSQLQGFGIPISAKFTEVVGEGLNRINAGESPQTVISDVFQAINNNPSVRRVMGSKLLKATKVSSSGSGSPSKITDESTSRLFFETFPTGDFNPSSSKFKNLTTSTRKSFESFANEFTLEERQRLAKLQPGFKAPAPATQPEVPPEQGDDGLVKRFIDFFRPAPEPVKEVPLF